MSSEKHARCPLSCRFSFLQPRFERPTLSRGHRAPRGAITHSLAANSATRKTQESDLQNDLELERRPRERALVSSPRVRGRWRSDDRAIRTCTLATARFWGPPRNGYTGATTTAGATSWRQQRRTTAMTWDLACGTFTSTLHVGAEKEEGAWSSGY